ncbi:tyrosine--tRNA ligase [Patescibacteria group bacterium]|nr:tyrosine--tRNA ligase [Patescibacteria group bacterium]MCG2701919.1 tyrosine--tRNA ligase [Candidatus Parcubacteria bacterium]MBU4265186.1 tyrosine--tRNA ligase [Patescibacteria group bacterium]MBU4390750.1 tyrosine--tRNA ligase [Patescibacteria group bacterium]MBU4396977.1 tyrosine--tRNA ligase [Patescibacteria group bacterium]
MTVDERLKLITRNCQEVLVEKELKELLGNGTELKHYIGFEISGMVHLGTGLISMGKIADFVKAGVKCQIFLADFHSYLNNKLGGNWENIRWATENYFKEGLIASLKCFGVDESQIEFITGKELYTDNIVHWETFMEVGKHVTLSRNLRSISIMGKMQGKDVDMATLFYPPLQVADIFTMGVNLAHAGTDQRKAHVIARQVAKKLIINPLKNAKGKVIAPIAIHQNLIAGLSGPTTGENSEESLKMSKSKPGSAIFVHDTADEIREKVKKAYGPPKEIEFNPLINWMENLVFWGEGESKDGLKVKRAERFGGDVSYYKIADLIDDYKSEKLHPMDLKSALSEWLVEKLEPARKHFESEKAKKGLEKMRKLMLSSQGTK